MEPYELEKQLRYERARTERIVEAIRFFATRYPGSESKYAEGWTDCAKMLVNWLDQHRENDIKDAKLPVLYPIME